jgi:hypothetical protein
VAGQSYAAQIMTVGCCWLSKGLSMQYSSSRQPYAVAECLITKQAGTPVQNNIVLCCLHALLLCSSPSVLLTAAAMQVL